MNKLPISARFYLYSVMLVGGLLTVLELARLTLPDLKLALVVAILSGLAQITKMEGPTERSSYNIAWVGYGFALILLGAPGAILVILLAHLAEWAKHRYPWYIQVFNIAQYVIVVVVSVFPLEWARSLVAPPPLYESLTVVLALAAFTGVNHLFIGIVLILARGQSIRESGVFEGLTLILDFTLLGMGAVGAYVWRVNPFVVFLSLAPLYLIYTTLSVPALQRKAQTDPKTNLFNSEYFTRALESELARCERYDRPLTIVMADLDLLRQVNNTYGHLAGDTCIITVSNILKKMVRDYDVVARFGGEEFAILMPETTIEQAYPRIEGIRAAIAAEQIEVSTSVTPIKVTMSFGMAERERFGLTAKEILHTADLAVYQAKLAGRNRIARQSFVSGESDASTPPVAPDSPPASEIKPPEAVVEPVQAAPASQPTAPQEPVKTKTDVPVTRPKPAWAINVYIAAVVVIAGLASAALLPSAPVPNWMELGLFAALVILAEGLAVSIYVRNTSVSTAAAPLIAGAMLFGPIGGVALGLFVAITSAVKHRSPVSRFLFNAANQVIAGLLSVGAMWLTGFVPSVFEPHLVTIAGAVLAGIAMYFITTVLLSRAIELSTGEPFRYVWTERFAWLWPYYLAMGVLAYVLSFAFEKGGWSAMLAMLVPLLMLRFSQAQYIEHTKAMVTELRASNHELQNQAREVSILNEELLMALSQAIDTRDPDVLDHSREVSRYAVMIARQLNLPPERVELVRKAGLLHDIGKLGIPETILFKPGRLTDAEYEIVQKHTDLGANIVGSAHSLQVLAPFIRHHHERFDGRGYPSKLMGHSIPLEARILSVADTVGSMASDRPYRRGQEVEAILREIQKHASTQFDPEVVQAFIQCVQRLGPTAITNLARGNAPIAPEEPKRAGKPMPPISGIVEAAI